MPRAISSVIIAAIVATSSVLALAQGGANAGSAAAGTGTGASSANAGPSAPSGMGTGAGSAVGRSGATPGSSAPPGMGTKDTGANLNGNNQTTNPNVQSPMMSRSAAQAARNAGVGHAANGLPIGAVGTGTSNEDQMTNGLSLARKRSAAQADGNAGTTPGRGASLSDQVSRSRAARAGDKVLDAQAQVERRTTVSHKRVPAPINGGM